MASKKKLGTAWSPKDIQVMRRCAKAGESARIAAHKLGRSRGAVAFKAMNERVRFRSIDQPRGVQKRLHQAAA
jgi:hypothetical protein